MPNNVIKDKSELAIVRILIALCVVLRPDAYNIYFVVSVIKIYFAPMFVTQKVNN